MATSAAAPSAQSTPKRRFGGDEVAYAITLFFALSIFAITALMVYKLWTNSAESRDKFGFSFLSSSLWNPVTDQYGALPYIYGTVITSFLALLISVPLGVGAAIYLSELADSKLSDALTFLVELLAAVPSVIYGLLAIFTLVPLMRNYIEPALKSALGPIPIIGELFSGPVF